MQDLFEPQTQNLEHTNEENVLAVVPIQLLKDTLLLVSDLHSLCAVIVEILYAHMNYMLMTLNLPPEDT